MDEESGEIFISNHDDFFKHLEDSLHIPRQNTEYSVQALLNDCARFNKKNCPRKRKTCFLQPIGTPRAEVYSPIEQNQLITLVTETIRFGHKRPNRRGRIEATYRFDRCVGVYSTFKNGRDESHGFETTELYSITVVYNQGIQRNSIVGVTAFPLFEET